MRNQKLTVKTPGKLMLAGEFAVLEKNYPLITMAVDRYVYVTIEESEKNKLHLINFKLNDIAWAWDDKGVTIYNDDNRFAFVKEAIEVTYTYLKEKGIAPKHCTMTIKSELDDGEGKKYGLGSSAAVVVAVVTSILNKNLHGPVSRSLIFKLASIIHVNVQGNGSGADIAASSYGGVVVYTSFQADWLRSEIERTDSITALVDKEWTYLSIKRIELPKQFHLKVGWTGTPASTKSLVRQISPLKMTNKKDYEQFLFASKQAVEQMIKGIKKSRFSTFLQGIRINRRALARLGDLANVEIETEKLCLLSESAEEFGGAGKLSGAGGGDCGIAFLPSEQAGEQLERKWKQIDIKPIQLSVSYLGTHLLKKEKND